MMDAGTMARAPGAGEGYHAHAMTPDIVAFFALTAALSTTAGLRSHGEGPCARSSARPGSGPLFRRRGTGARP